MAPAMGQEGDGRRAREGTVMDISPRYHGERERRGDFNNAAARDDGIPEEHDGANGLFSEVQQYDMQCGVRKTEQTLPYDRKGTEL